VGGWYITKKPGRKFQKGRGKKSTLHSLFANLRENGVAGKKLGRAPMKGGRSQLGNSWEEKLVEGLWVQKEAAKLDSKTKEREKGEKGTEKSWVDCKEKKRSGGGGRCGGGSTIRTESQRGREKYEVFVALQARGFIKEEEDGRKKKKICKGANYTKSLKKKEELEGRCVSAKIKKWEGGGLENKTVATIPFSRVKGRKPKETRRGLEWNLRKEIPFKPREGRPQSASSKNWKW